MSVESFVADLPIREVVGTPDGLDLLESNAELQDVVANFATTEHHSSLFGYELIGAGDMGQVRAVDGLAVKVATPSTNRLDSSRLPNGQRYADDLINQFSYLTALDLRAKQRSDGRVSTPAQHFALTTEQGNSLLVQEHVRDSQSLETWYKRDDINPWERPDEWAINSAMKKHIVQAVGASVLRLGLIDLVQSSPYFVNGRNLLVRADAKQPQDEPFKIIDQPGPGPIGNWTAGKARASLERRSRRGTPLIRSLMA